MADIETVIGKWLPDRQMPSMKSLVMDSIPFFSSLISKFLINCLSYFPKKNIFAINFIFYLSLSLSLTVECIFVDRTAILQY